MFWARVDRRSFALLWRVLLLVLFPSTFIPVWRTNCWVYDRYCSILSSIRSKIDFYMNAHTPHTPTIRGIRYKGNYGFASPYKKIPFANWKRRWHVIVICSFNSECRGGSVDMVLINLLIWLVCVCVCVGASPRFGDVPLDCSTFGGLLF